MKTGTVVCIHAWRYEDDCQTYCDPEHDGVRADGWCVYERIARPDGKFEVFREKDFASYYEAMAWAGKRAAILRCPVNRY